MLGIQPHLQFTGCFSGTSFFPVSSAATAPPRVRSRSTTGEEPDEIEDTFVSFGAKASRVLRELRSRTVRGEEPDEETRITSTFRLDFDIGGQDTSFES